MNDLTFCEILDGEDKSSPLKNCIRNNYKHFRKWGKRAKTNAFRIYDRDIKEYPFVVDFYAGRFCVQFIEFEEDKEEEWQEELNEVLCSLFFRKDFYI